MLKVVSQNNETELENNTKKIGGGEINPKIALYVQQINQM